MMTVNGERVWVPTEKQDLVEGLQRMGIYKVAGRSLAQLSVKQLTAAYCSERARIVRRSQQERHEGARTAKPAGTAIQLELLRA